MNIRLTDLFMFMQERQMIYEKKIAGLPKPWTNDKILQTYRFCNIYREQDTVTQWISENWRMPYHDNPDIFFFMALSRLINWPDTLAAYGSPAEPWNPDKFINTLKARAIAGKKVFSSAYIVSTNGCEEPKPEYLVRAVLNPLWEARERIRPKKGEFLRNYHTRLSAFNGFGSFLAAQVVADLKYIAPLNKAPDWLIWAASGPGSRRGLNRVYRRPPTMGWSGERQWYVALHDLHVVISGLCKKANMPELHAQDLQNALCEFDKYERVRLGEGKPRQLYNGVSDELNV